MEPKLKRQTREATEARMRKLRQRTCKGSQFEVIEIKSDDTNQEYEFGITNTGCGAPRRNGSAWCQACSDNKTAYAPDR